MLLKLVKELMVLGRWAGFLIYQSLVQQRIREPALARSVGRPVKDRATLNGRRWRNGDEPLADHGRPPQSLGDATRI